MKRFKKMLQILQNELRKKDEIIKTLLKTQIPILQTVINPSVEQEVSTKRNEILEEIQL